MKPALVFTHLLCALALGAETVHLAIREGKSMDARGAPEADADRRFDTFERKEFSGRASAVFSQALRLDQFGGDCVAYDTSASICLLTVEAFNRALEDGAPPLGIDETVFPTRSRIDAIRGELLQRILEGKYASAPPIPAGVRDSLSALADAVVRDRNRASRASLGESALRSAYRELYPAAFKGGEEILYEALASTDSILLDSLRAAPSPDARGAWQKVPEDDIPAEAVDALRNAGAGSVAGPVRLPYGYMYLREASRRKRPDLSLDSALPLLLAWIRNPKEGAPGWDREMVEYHRRHPGAFVAPDTVTFRAWLLPGGGTGAASLGPRARMWRTDTARARSLAVQGKDLPRSMQQALSGLRPLRRGEALGPIPSVFGTWYLLALEVRKGGRRLSFEESRPLIGKILYGWEGPETLLPSVADSRAREAEIREAITARYRMDRKSSDAARQGRSGIAAANPGRPDIAETALPWEAEREDWMRTRLVLRYVELPGPGASQANGPAGPLPDSSWSDGAEGARSP